MENKKRIILAVTTDLNYDQRMMRICMSLHTAGYEVLIVGIEKPNSKPLTPQPYQQQRLSVYVNAGKLFYLIYWVKLFFFLLFQRADALVAIDLDAILPIYWVSRIRGIKRVHDAHEIFTEMQEVNQRPFIKKLWEWIGNYTVPKFKKGYTIGDGYVDFFKQKYGVHYFTVRNATVLRPFTIPTQKEKVIYYQGAVNVGRAFEKLIPAMQYVNAPLIIAGNGNFAKETEMLIQQYQLEDKVKMLGFIPPAQLKEYTAKAYIGITLFDAENNGMSNQLSLANRYFDYMHHGVPQICCDFSEYHTINEQWELAYLVKDLNPTSIAAGLNKMLEDESYYQSLSDNAMKARSIHCWQNEEIKLLAFYKKLLD